MLGANLSNSRVQFSSVEAGTKIICGPFIPLSRRCAMKAMTWIVLPRPKVSETRANHSPISSAKMHPIFLENSKFSQFTPSS